MYIVAACAIAAGAIALFVINSDENDQSGPPAAGTAKPALTVTTTGPQRGTLALQLTANGNIAAWQEASIGTESNGLRLAEVRVNVGDVVQRGQVLARFASESVQADVAQARAGVAEATANAAEATANADRVRALQSTGTFSGQQIQQYLTAEQAAKARVASAQAGLAAQQLRLRQTQVLAPDSGLISARSATVGAVLGSGVELFRLIRQGRLEWRAEVAAADLARIVPGTKVMVTAAGGDQRPGRVRMVAPTVDPQTRVGLVYVDLPTDLKAGSVGAPPPGFKAGMFARGEFSLGSSSALTVPQSAVVVRDGFSYVFRVNPDQRVSQLKLQIGRRAGGQLEVLGGLEPDALLVASGAGFLNEGDLVKVVPATAPISEPNQPIAPVLPASAAIK
ncbi:MAG: efflux RND transporter periplasmic adaptor subunit [Rhodoferax sp.]